MTALHVQPPWIEMTLVTPPSGALGLSFSVQAGQGALCEALGANKHFYATLVNSSNVRETVQITGRTGDSFTLAERGVDGGYLSGTTRTAGGYGSWTTGDKAYVGWTRVTLEEMIAAASKADALGTIAGDSTLTDADIATLHRFTASAVATLPLASADLVGKRMRFKNAGYWNARIARNGSNTIDGETAQVRVPGLETIELVCVSATAWEVVQAPEAEVGDLIWSGATTRRGCLLPYGQELSRAVYAGLDAVYGTTFGAYTNGAGGAGTTHFRMPDARGRTLAGQDNMGGSAANRLTAGVSGVAGTTLGAVGGDQQLHQHLHTGSANAVGDHAHTGYTDPQGNHGHGFNGGQGVPISTGQTAGQEGAIQSFTGYGLIYNTDAAGNHQHNVQTYGAGGHGHALNIANAGAGVSQNVQPTMIGSLFVKA